MRGELWDSRMSEVTLLDVLFEERRTQNLIMEWFLHSLDKVWTAVPTGKARGLGRVVGTRLGSALPPRAVCLSVHGGDPGGPLLAPFPLSLPLQGRPCQNLTRVTSCDSTLRPQILLSFSSSGTSTTFLS